MVITNKRESSMDTYTDPMIPDRYYLKKYRKDTHDTFTLELLPCNGNSSYSFRAGQFNMLYMFGAGEIPISISGDPARPAPLIHTIRAVGSVTRLMQGLKPGSVLGVRGPFGSSWPVMDSAGNDIVIIAGGIGLAPLRPVIYQVLSWREKYGKFILYYGARTPRDLLYRRELERWRGRFDTCVEVTVDSAKGNWMGNVGVVTKLISRHKFDPDNTVAMICGPGIMMRFTVTELLDHGLSEENIFVSMERNMKCGIGLCGHCQLGTELICRDGPVYNFGTIKNLFDKREI
jgi:NAD(P)H-flavin reductase